MSETEQLNELARTLMPQVRAGDRNAIDRLLRGCRLQIHRWALSRTADLDDADDVAQMTLIRLKQTVAGFRGESRFTTWLYRMVGNVFVDFHRRRARRAELGNAHTVHGLIAGQLATGGDEQLDQIHNAHVAGLVRFFFDKLPARQREIFDLVDLQGFTPAEVSRMTGVNDATVRAHLFKARRAIRRRIIMNVPALAEELTE